jgi:hypothetical protein
MLAAMIFRVLAVVLACLAAFSPGARAQSGRQGPAVVELFTSQGCIDCPRANRLLGMMSHQPGVIALTYSVRIWDYLGWRDTLAQPQFIDRQRAYGRALRVHGYVTPQFIFNGVTQNSGADWDTARALMDDARAAPPPDGAPEVSIRHLSGGRVRVTLSANPRGAGAEVWLVGYDPIPVSVLVTGGLNIDRMITHFNVVTSIQRAEVWNGSAMWLERPHCTPECAVLVQRPGPGAILAAAATQRPRPR